MIRWGMFCSEFYCKGEILWGCMGTRKEVGVDVWQKLMVGAEGVEI